MTKVGVVNALPTRENDILILEQSKETPHMPLLSRRGFLATATATLGASTLPGVGWSGEPAPAAKAIPMLHATDLFRPHNDPDDHWDLACVYALAWQGDADLLGILIDYPQPDRPNDPDVQAVAQMNYLTGKAAPIMVGSPRRFTSAEAAMPENQAALRGVRAMLERLRKSPEPVVISILGSCRDVALAGQLEPKLFAKKCAAIYLNAGSGTPDPVLAKQLEWNVHLDAASYAAIFRLPCPIYWMPCFEVVPSPGKPFEVSAYGTFYRFRQGDVLPKLSDSAQNFFAYVFKQSRPEMQQGAAGAQRPEWLRYLLGAKEPDCQRRIAAMQRNMWCTGGFLHAAGMTVSGDGRIVPLSQTKDPVFTFDPIQVTCSARGVTEWRPDPAATNRFIFHVRDPERYAAAMTAALKSLLSKLP